METVPPKDQLATADLGSGVSPRDGWLRDMRANIDLLRVSPGFIR